MNVIVTDSGFAADEWTRGFVTLEALFAHDAQPACALDLSQETPVETLQTHAPQILRFAMIRIAFPSFADGRGFTLARQLRLLGYQGRLRAHGHVIADQYAMARRAGFDEVQIDDALAARQPEAQWLYRSNWQAYDHQSRLRG